VSYEEELCFYFDRESVQITRERWEELERDWRYTHLRVTETDRYRVETVWKGRFPASTFPLGIPPLPPGQRLFVFRTETTPFIKPVGDNSHKQVTLICSDTEEGATRSHERVVAEAEALYPKRS
jgi:hypothetical protein